MLLAASNTFWPSVRTPMTTSSEIDVAFRSSRTRTTVPSRINRTIGSSASERAFQASQSFFTLRHTRLTVSLPTAPANRVLSARRTLARQVAAGDQRVGGQRAALIGTQRLALPLGGLAVGCVEPRARHRNRNRPEAAGQRARPAAVPMARNAGRFLTVGLLAAFVARARKG